MLINANVKQVTDLRVVLADLRQFIEQPQLLRSGRQIRNFKMLPRELLANWLLCASRKNSADVDLTIAEDPDGGDGLIVDRKSKAVFHTEHVFLPPEALSGATAIVEDQMVAAVAHKVRKGGAQYAAGRDLVIFSEAHGHWVPRKVAHRIAGTHGFDGVFAIAFMGRDDFGYHYGLTELSVPSAPTWTIIIRQSFTRWTVRRLQ